VVAAKGRRGISSVPDPQPTARESSSERRADLVRLAIEAGVDGMDSAEPTIASYVGVIVTGLSDLWADPSFMMGEPKP